MPVPVDRDAAVDVTVLGAGVVGLTTAIVLAEAGVTVRVVAKGTGASTTSYGSGALWRPVSYNSLTRHQCPRYLDAW